MSKKILRIIFYFWILIQGIPDVFSAATAEKHPLDGYDRFKSAPLKKARTEPEASLPPAASGKPFKPETNYDKFERIMKMGPHPIPSFQGITWEDEIREGSRRWVHHFDKGIADDWHKKMVQTVNAFVAKMKSDQLLAAEKNIAVAQVTFCNKNGSGIKSLPLKYFFCSGWQAKEAQHLRKLLAEGKLGKPLEDYKEYDLRFITTTYRKHGKEEVKSSAAFKEGVFRELCQRQKLHLNFSLKAEPVWEENIELREGQSPILKGGIPLPFDVHYSRIDQLKQSIFAGKRSLGFGVFSNLPMEALNGVGRVN